MGPHSHSRTDGPHLRNLIQDAIRSGDTNTKPAVPYFVEDVWPTLRPRYMTLTRRVKRFCIKQLQQQGIKCTVTARTKSTNSTKATLDRREKKHREDNYNASFTMHDIFEEMHDLSGVRIVVEFSSDMDAAKQFVQHRFSHNKPPNIFTKDRRCGAWDTVFGAYQTTNYHVSIETPSPSASSANRNTRVYDNGGLYSSDPDEIDEEDPDDDENSDGQYIPGSHNFLPFEDAGVLFEIQVVSLPEDMYNTLAHDLLYKKLAGPLTRQDEIVLDLSHGISLCHGLVTMYFKDKLKDIDFNTSQGFAKEKPVPYQILSSGQRQYDELKKKLPPESLANAPEEFSVPLEAQASMDNFAQWINTYDQKFRAAFIDWHHVAKQHLEIAKKQYTTAQQHLEVGQEQVKLAHQHIETTKSHHDKRLHSECLQALRAAGGNIPYEWYKDRTPDRVPGTCEWFLGQEALCKWQTKNTSGVLYVSADPGCGKTVLSRFLVEEHFPSLFPGVPVLYFFFKDPDQSSVCQALSAILHQLFSRRPDVLQAHAVKQFHNNGSAMAQNEALMWNILKDIRQDPSTGPLIIALDGLDESKQASLPSFVGGMRAMMKKEGGSCVRVLVTSRPYPSINRAMGGISDMLHIPGEESSIDISREVDLVIDQRVRDLAITEGLAPSLVIHLQNGLKKTPHRTYLWVHLAFHLLSSETFQQTKKCIDDLLASIPRTYAEAYDKILGRAKNQDEVRRVLSIILAARRPLTVAEMNVAVHASSLSATVDELDLEPSAAFQKRLREICGLFVSVHCGHVYLIHQTAREFLLRTPESPVENNTSSCTWYQSISKQDAAFVLAKACVRYLRIYSLNPMVISDDLWKYALGNWTDHVNEGQLLQRLEADIIVLCETMIQNESKLLECDMSSNFCCLGIPETANIFVALEIGSIVMLRSALQTGLNLNVEYLQGSLGRTALNNCVVKRNLEFMEILLQHGADIETRDWSHPLQVAARYGDNDVVELLLHYRANINHIDSYGRTALIEAAECGHAKVVQTLLQHGAKVHYYDERERTALSAALQYNRLDIARLLLHYGMDVEETNNLGETPLFFAAASKNPQAVELMLQHGAKIDHVNDEGATPLIRAVMYSTLETVRVLLQNGADVNHTDGCGGSALSAAVRCGDPGMARVLLQHGANVNILDLVARTLLHLAANCGDAETARILIQYGVDVSIRNDRGQTALDVAKEFERDVFVALLESHMS